VPQAGWTAGTVRTAGGSRNFKLWIPSTPESGRPWPLLMLLHGCRLDAARMAAISGMNDVAEANRFLVVYPEQSRRANLLRCWNWFRPEHQERGAGEPSVLAAIVGQVQSNYNIDPERVYVAGVSAGGAMATILAATYPDLFAALAVFAGAEFKAACTISEGFAAMKRGGPDPTRQGQLAFEVMRSGLAETKRRRIPVIVLHGTADDRVSPVNADQIITQWGKTNACLAEEQAETGFSLTEKVIDGKVAGGYAYQRHIYVENDSRLLLEKWLVQGLRHAWSGSPESSKYGDPKGPNASAEIWRFFCEAGSKSTAYLSSPGFPQPSSSETTK
jgi:poly(hydroxyalkanoate) depolymerase family esterase